MKTLHVDDFVALNDEIRALSESQVSMSAGLRAVSDEYPSRVATVARRVADGLEQGRSLPDTLQAECGLPDAYAAVVAAGIRAGRLSAALEGVAETSRRIASLRRLIIVSMVYPLVIVGAAYGLMLYLLASQPIIIPEIYEMFGLGQSPFAFYQTMQDTMLYWAPIPPLVALGVITFTVLRLGRSVNWTGSGSRFAKLTEVIYLSRISAFLELLSLLIENQTPLDEAVELASAGTANAALKESGRQLAELIRAGGGRRDDRFTPGIPPMVQWLLASNLSHAQLLHAIRRNARSYVRRTERSAKLLALYLPVVCSVLFGGVATAALALFVLAPWYHFLVRLGAS